MWIILFAQLKIWFITPCIQGRNFKQKQEDILAVRADLSRGQEKSSVNIFGIKGIGNLNQSVTFTLKVQVLRNIPNKKANFNNFHDRVCLDIIYKAIER